MLRKRNRQGNSGQLVPIRQLAEFSADPKGFEKHRGKIRNKTAVRAGNQGEERLGKTGSIVGPVIVAIILGIIVWLWI